MGALEESHANGRSRASHPVDASVGRAHDQHLGNHQRRTMVSVQEARAMVTGAPTNGRRAVLNNAVGHNRRKVRHGRGPHIWGRLGSAGRPSQQKGVGSGQPGALTTNTGSARARRAPLIKRTRRFNVEGSARVGSVRRATHLSNDSNRISMEADWRVEGSSKHRRIEASKVQTASHLHRSELGVEREMRPLDGQVS